MYVCWKKYLMAIALLLIFSVGCSKNEDSSSSAPEGTPSIIQSLVGDLNDDGVVDQADVLDRALQLADQIAANSPLAVRESRRGVREIAHLSLADGYELQERIGSQLRKTEDAREAQRAFVEKRKPEWKGR